MKFWNGRHCSERFYFFPPPKKPTNREFWNNVKRTSAQVDWISIVVSLLVIGLMVWMVVQCL